jgi:ubiquinone/menaquinone biosynthesis C-methylase UbiE
MQESSFLNPTKVLVAAGVHDGMKIADLGCGAGFFTRAAARLAGHKGVVWAVDAHQDMLPRVKSLALAEGLHTVEVMRGNIEKESGSKLPGGTFDLCIAANIFFSAGNKKALADEIARVLKRGGRALVVDWAGSFGGLGPQENHVVSAEDVRAMCKEAGLEFEHSIPAGAYHWGLILKKK